MSGITIYINENPDLRSCPMFSETTDPISTGGSITDLYSHGAYSLLYVVANACPSHQTHPKTIISRG